MPGGRLSGSTDWVEAGVWVDQHHADRHGVGLARPGRGRAAPYHRYLRRPVLPRQGPRLVLLAAFFKITSNHTILRKKKPFCTTVIVGL